MHVGRRQPLGKEWDGALAVAGWVSGKRAARIAIVARDAQASRDMANLISKACGEIGVRSPFTCRVSRLVLGWPNGSRAKFFLADRPLDQCGESHDAAWFHDLQRNKESMATLESIAYGLQREFGIGQILETGTLNERTFPQLRICSPRLVEFADQLLRRNSAWGTAWSIRDSDAEENNLTIRWGDSCRARVSLIPEVPHPLFCVRAPDCLESWIGEPRAQSVFAFHLQKHYRWDGGGRRLIRPLLLEGKTMSECVAIAERIASEKSP